MMQTPREISGSWFTTGAEEATFLAALAADSSRVAVEQVGAGAVDGAPIFLVSIGIPTPPTPGASDSILVIGLQHAEETASRESTIEFCRDLAYTDDPALVAYLTAHPVYVLVTTNPDRIGDVTRNNKNNVDLNRDHLALSQSETRAIQNTIRRIRPSIIIDIHENNGTGVTMQFGSPTQAQAAPTVRAAATALREAIEAHVIAQGFTVGAYSAGNTPQILRNTGSLRHSLCILFETDRTSFTTPVRISQNLTALRGVIDHHAASAASIQLAISAGRSGKIAEGLAAGAPFTLGATILSPPPRAYRLSGAQRAVAAAHIQAFDIATIPDGAGWLVPMGQEAQPLIPFLFDAESEWAVVPAERVYDIVPLPAAARRAAGGSVVVDGVVAPIVRTVLWTGSQLLTANR